MSTSYRRELDLILGKSFAPAFGAAVLLVIASNVASLLGYQAVALVVGLWAIALGILCAAVTGVRLFWGGGDR